MAQRIRNSLYFMSRNEGVKFCSYSSQKMPLFDGNHPFFSFSETSREFTVLFKINTTYDPKSCAGDYNGFIG